MTSIFLFVVLKGARGGGPSNGDPRNIKRETWSSLFTLSGLKIGIDVGQGGSVSRARRERSFVILDPPDGRGRLCRVSRRGSLRSALIASHPLQGRYDFTGNGSAFLSRPAKSARVLDRASFSSRIKGSPFRTISGYVFLWGPPGTTPWRTLGGPFGNRRVTRRVLPGSARVDVPPPWPIGCPLTVTRRNVGME